jgi:hypothetical protein
MIAASKMVGALTMTKCTTKGGPKEEDALCCPVAAAVAASPHPPPPCVTHYRRKCKKAHPNSGQTDEVRPTELGIFPELGLIG